jgi:hypothetical protein
MFNVPIIIETSSICICITESDECYTLIIPNGQVIYVEVQERNTRNTEIQGIQKYKEYRNTRNTEIQGIQKYKEYRNITEIQKHNRNTET